MAPAYGILDRGPIADEDDSRANRQRSLPREVIGNHHVRGLDVRSGDEALCAAIKGTQSAFAQLFVVNCKCNRDTRALYLRFGRIVSHGLSARETLTVIC